ncbi:hypothetical protein FA95DRAFT_1560219 [Auriscalpium vulgare]|uniref:Uncharacterized protein n=1 Tax=Auriscalpium vulgare TaxID=40419 RepID=A0ACB8RS70_9AGAM|nr:hypothetical protein FA95DRAFT_1560219 [Auriscalpium vulgare]
MVQPTLPLLALFAALFSAVSAHISIFHNSMWGFNQTSDPNRPQDPLMNLPFSQWWFHGHLDYPPHPNDIMQLPVGGKITTELNCDKGATSWYASSPGGDVRDPSTQSPCHGQPTTQYHTNGINDLGGCALGVAYKSDVADVQPDDFVIFSVNQTCVWYRDTDFQVPPLMPACPNGKCICAWFWIHNADSGSEQMYMTGFQCNMQGANSTVPVARGQVPKRCGADPANNVPAHPSNCTEGAKTPMYWYQAEGNNMFEGTYTPPVYNDLYNFRDGAQNDIFSNSTAAPPTVTSSSHTSSHTSSHASSSHASSVHASSSHASSVHASSSHASSVHASLHTSSHASPHTSSKHAEPHTSSKHAPTHTSSKHAEPHTSSKHAPTHTSSKHAAPHTTSKHGASKHWPAATPAARLPVHRVPRPPVHRPASHHARHAWGAHRRIAEASK